MESDLDKIEKDGIEWKNIVRNFYEDFDKVLESVKDKTKELKIHLKENETDEICDLCGAHMLVKHSRFGKFLGCSNYPDCKNIKKIVQSLGIKCPKCDGNIIKRVTKKKRVFYGCSNYPSCDFASWYQPTEGICEVCGSPLFLKGKKVFCESCANKNKKD